VNPIHCGLGAALVRGRICGVRPVTLETSDGHTLAGDVAHPDGLERAGVVICHPHPRYGGTRFNMVVEALFSRLPEAGFVTLRFDFRADHDGGIAERLDVVAALDALEQEVLGVPLFVAGYSFGAIVALTTVDPRIAGIVAIAPPLTSAVPAPEAPALLLTPQHDQFCPPETASAVVGDWPNVECQVVEGADHFLAGHTAFVAARTSDWLSHRS
jgi:alpha/beta superfamily hydrolase